MLMLEKMAPRVLMVALLAVIGLAVLPGVSHAQSALQVISTESSCELDPVINSTNVTAGNVCENIYIYNRWGCLEYCTSVELWAFSSLDPDDCDWPLAGFEGSIFIVSTIPDNFGNCSPVNLSRTAAGGLRSSVIADDMGPIGIPAQDAAASKSTLAKLVSDCASSAP